jgi:DNA invertase Pin-like site-specific DNA recombinase
LVDELNQRGCRVECVDRPMSDDPHDQLLLQIRSAVAEYERTLISERMRPRAPSQTAKRPTLALDARSVWVSARCRPSP